MKKETMKCRKEIRLYSWELEELQKQAEKMGLSDSQYLRMLITNRPRGLPGNPQGTGTHEPGNQPDWCKHQPDYP